MNVEQKHRNRDLVKLDDLVIAEFEALLTPFDQAATDQFEELGEQSEQEPDERVVYPHPFAERPRTTGELDDQHAPDTPGADVLGFELQHREPGDTLFSAEEENFIASTSAWLRGRQNADVVLDEVWRLVVGFDGEDADHHADTEPSEPIETPHDIDAIDSENLTDDVKPKIGTSESKPKPKTTGAATRRRKPRKTTSKKT